MKDNLVPAPAERPLPDSYHARTGHALHAEKSTVYQQLMSKVQYAESNYMKINFKKTKLMIFNFG